MRRKLRFAKRAKRASQSSMIFIRSLCSRAPHSFLVPIAQPYYAEITRRYLRLYSPHNSLIQDVCYYHSIPAVGSIPTNSRPRLMLLHEQSFCAPTNLDANTVHFHQQRMGCAASAKAWQEACRGYTPNEEKGSEQSSAKSLQREASRKSGRARRADATDGRRGRERT